MYCIYHDRCNCIFLDKMLLYFPLKVLLFSISMTGAIVFSLTGATVFSLIGAIVLHFHDRCYCIFPDMCYYIVFSMTGATVLYFPLEVLPYFSWQVLHTVLHFQFFLLLFYLDMLLTYMYCSDSTKGVVFFYVRYSFSLFSNTICFSWILDFSECLMFLNCTCAIKKYYARVQ